jgi:cobalt-zinc-cadmium efflux system protein
LKSLPSILKNLKSNWSRKVQQHQHVHHDHCDHSHHSYRDLLPTEGDPGALSDEVSHQATQKASQKVRRLTYVLLLVASFSTLEVAIASYSHSMALLADAGHLFSDCLALFLSLLGAWIVQRNKSDDRRVETAIALFNALSLVAIGGGVAIEAIVQLQAPAAEILSLPMLIAALVGLVVNSVNILLLHDHRHDDLNLKGAFLHIIADAMISVGVLVAALAVWQMHWLWADGAISLFIALLIVVSSLPLVTQSCKLLIGDRLLS